MRKITLSKNRIQAYIKNFSGVVDVEFPELIGKLGFKEDVVPILKIKAASLDDHLRARTIIERASIMALKIIESLEKNELHKMFDLEAINKELRDPVNEKAFLEVSIFHRCVVKPKFTMKESYRLSQVMPEVVNRVANRALEMSSLESIDGN